MGNTSRGAENVNLAASSLKSIGVLVLAVVLAACAGTTEQSPSDQIPASPPPSGDAITFADPFAYCAAVGTVDAPDERYTGPAIPDGVVQGLIDLDLVTADAPREFAEHAVWRCVDGQVTVCHFGANLPCTEKADTSREPSAAMREFCQSTPDEEFIPAAVTGRATVYEWRCTGSTPEVAREVLHADARGFLSEFWHLLPNP
jgi:hypothetical protein